mgnify:CR=1 FL=1
MGDDNHTSGPMAGGDSKWSKLGHWLGLFLGATIFFMMAVTFVDVVGRYFFNAPLPAADELTKLAMGVSIFAGLPLVTRLREHVTISLLDGLFSGPAFKVRQTFIDLVCMGVVAVLCWRLIIQAEGLAQYNDKTLFLGVPLAPFALFMAFMSGVTILVLLAMLWRDIVSRQSKDNG